MIHRRNLRLALPTFTWILVAATAPAATPLEVMSFNIRGDFDQGVATDDPNAWLSRSGEHRRDLAMATIRRADADIIGVQEAFANQMRDLQEALPEMDSYGVGRVDGDAKGEHCGIFYRRDRFARIDAGTFWLSETPNQPSIHPAASMHRIASWVVLSDELNDGREFFILNSHWSHTAEGKAAREFSANLIREKAIKIAGARPVVVMGDFNAVESRPAIRTLLGDEGQTKLKLIDSYRQIHPERKADERTAHSFKGATTGQRIDYVLHSKHFRTEAAGIEREEKTTRYPSDHCPVTATLKPVEAEQTKSDY